MYLSPSQKYIGFSEMKEESGFVPQKYILFYFSWVGEKGYVAFSTPVVDRELGWFRFGQLSTII